MAQNANVVNPNFITNQSLVDLDSFLQNTFNQDSLRGNGRNVMRSYYDMNMIHKTMHTFHVITNKLLDVSLHYLQRDVLVLQRTEDREFETTIIEFSNALPDMIPEFGVARRTLHRSSVVKSRSARYGQGLFMSSDFRNTVEGRQIISAKMLHFIQVARRLMAYIAFNTLLVGANLDSRHSIRHITNEILYHRHIQYDIDNFALANKDAYGLVKLVAHNKQVMLNDSGHVPNILIMPADKAGLIMRTNSLYTEYYKAGPNGPQKFIDDLEELTNLHGISVRPSPQLTMANSGAPATMKRSVTIGNYGVIAYQPGQEKGQPIQVNLYDGHKFDYSPVSLKSMFINSGRFKLDTDVYTAEDQMYYLDIDNFIQNYPPGQLQANLDNLDPFLYFDTTNDTFKIRPEFCAVDGAAPAPFETCLDQQFTLQGVNAVSATFGRVQHQIANALNLTGLLTGANPPGGGAVYNVADIGTRGTPENIAYRVLQECGSRIFTQKELDALMQLATANQARVGPNPAYAQLVAYDLNTRRRNSMTSIPVEYSPAIIGALDISFKMRRRKLSEWLGMIDLSHPETLNTLPSDFFTAIAFRPHETLQMEGAIMVQGGIGLGYTACGEDMFEAGTDPINFSFSIDFRVWIGIVIKDWTKVRNIRDQFYDGVLVGGNTKVIPITPKNRFPVRLDHFDDPSIYAAIFPTYSYLSSDLNFEPKQYIHILGINDKITTQSRVHDYPGAVFVQNQFRWKDTIDNQVNQETQDIAIYCCRTSSEYICRDGGLIHIDGNTHHGPLEGSYSSEVRRKGSSFIQKH